MGRFITSMIGRRRPAGVPTTSTTAGSARKVCKFADPGWGGWVETLGAFMHDHAYSHFFARAKLSF